MPIPPTTRAAPAATSQAGLRFFGTETIDAYDVFGVCHDEPLGADVLGAAHVSDGTFGGGGGTLMLPELVMPGTVSPVYGTGAMEGGRSLARSTGSALVASGSTTAVAMSGVGRRIGEASSSGIAWRIISTTSSKV